MIVLFTDFGPAGPYTGQMESVLAQLAPDIAVIDLLSDAPAFKPKACAYLLAALVQDFPKNAVFLCIVDPGVGSERSPLIVRAGQQWFVGPHNGIFDIVINQSNAEDAKAWTINYSPTLLSASFHGSDLFAPVAAMIARGDPLPGNPIPIKSIHGELSSNDLSQVIYIDHYGNAITGIKANQLSPKTKIQALNKIIIHARVFSDVETGELFWYENANGLVEIAVNKGRASDYGFKIGVSVNLS